MSKKERKRSGSFPYSQEIWRDALSDLRDQLADDCLKKEPDQLQFQTGLLFENLKRRIETAGKDRLKTMDLCYRFVTDRSLDLGYDEPRRLHFEEINALEAEPISKRKGYRPLTPTQQEIADRLKRDRLSKLKESIFLAPLRSIANWMEAQESFSMWLSFNNNRAVWRGDPDARAQATQAYILATALSYMRVYEFKGRRIKGVRLWEGQGVGANYKGDVWTSEQWANILAQAARLAGKGEAHCSPLEKWVWWCYPVFHRHGWNAREVRKAALAHFHQQVAIPEAEKFRRHWMNLGLRFAGRRTSREDPPLAEFVRHISVPDPDKVRGVPIWG